MAKVHIHKDLIVRIQNSLCRHEMGWLYGSIVPMNDGKHVFIKECSTNYEQQRDPLGWFIANTASIINEETAKKLFRKIHVCMMNRFIEDNMDNSRLRKYIGSLIGLSLSVQVLTEARETPTQIFKNEICVYSVYTPDAYMQALFQHVLQAKDKNLEFDHALSLRRDVSLVIHPGQMSQFFRLERQMNLSETLSPNTSYFNLSYEASIVNNFPNRFFGVEKVEQFCEEAMENHQKLLDEYEEEYKQSQRLKTHLHMLEQLEYQILSQIQQNQNLQ
jgi:hypothetical protein